MTPGQAPPAPPDAPTAPLATHPIGAEAMRRAKRLPAMVDGITPRARRVARLRLTFGEDVDVTITYRTAEIDHHDNLEMNIALTSRDVSAVYREAARNRRACGYRPVGADVAAQGAPQDPR